MNYRKGYLALSLTAAAILYSCGSGNGQETAQQAVALPTDFVQVNTGNEDVATGYPGSIEGQDNVEIKAQVTGYLEAVYIKEGQFVSKGQTLFRINPSVYNEQVNTNEAALKSALAAQESARLEVEKLRPLVEGKVVSDMQLKTAQASLKAASAQVAQAQSSLGSSKINANFTYIKAPVSGYIGRIPNRVGNLISPSDASPLTTLSNISSVNVYFSMNEADFIAHSRAAASGDHADNVELILADGSKYGFKGRLENASGNFDKNTGSIQMKAVFQNPDKLLRSGGTGRVMIHNALDGVVKLPKTSVKDIQDKFFVYKLEGKDKVKMTQIEVSGSTSQDYFVKTGVNAGDKIAVNRIDALTDGALVVAKVTPSK
ncbi:MULTISPECIES: efflux RND transporter periplasmic adaptor subunit [unclassified Chryseobacterium]|uniref:efflux RND transporter periplasmic adaptor subunit n=1 Tax=unclassified Chryseobacterium TaxID=2593645 RepID=UPI00100C0E7D|nr:MULTISPECIES: efflux RND transporter periplasmic adaptor subunit [unclassified Chryseobacterium]RXM52246.1 efflux transporter periplasmic adaptor subunit [Chryseobacterium sp. CH25]RXM64154.1 efflux transporter periplasmic adaptor subunit [Chryseobacterium sp. CH1]